MDSLFGDFRSLNTNAHTNKCSYNTNALTSHKCSYKRPRPRPLFRLRERGVGIEWKGRKNDLVYSSGGRRDIPNGR